MGQPKIDKVDISDYLAIEREDKVRYEFHHGHLIRMAGGSIPHTELCNNTAYALTRATREQGGCKAFNSEMKVEISPGGRYVYPDAGVSCPDHIESKTIKGAITNPRLIVEVTSPETADYDRGKKFRLYFSIPSVREYMLVSQNEPLVMMYRKHGDGDLFGFDSAFGLDEEIELKSLGFKIKLSEIYFGLELPSSEEREIT